MSDNTELIIQHPILTEIDGLQKHALARCEAMALASKFCPDTEIAKVMDNVYEAFLFFEISLFSIRSQVEALLDERNEQSFQNVEGPDQ